MDHGIPNQNIQEEPLTPDYLVRLYQASDARVDQILLPGLDTINWHNLRHAHGPASDVPALLRATLSTHQDHRDFAFKLLHETIWHQGTIYQATRYVVPFLIALLVPDTTPDKAATIFLLESIANGYPSVSEDSTWQREWYAKQSRDFAAAVKKAAQDVQLAREAVRQGIKQYMSLLTDPHADIRRRIAPLLCSFPEEAVDVVATLQRHMLTETVAPIKAETIEQLMTFFLSSPHLPSEGRIRFIRICEWLATAITEARMVKFAAAVAVTHFIPKQVADDIVCLLLDAVSRAEGIHPSYYDDLHPRGQSVLKEMVIETVTHTLALLDPTRCIDYLMEALVCTTEPSHAHTLAIALFSLSLCAETYTVRYRGHPVFEHKTLYYGCVYPRAADGVEERIYPIMKKDVAIDELGQVQRAAIRAVLNSKYVWGMRSNLLEAFGLPRSATVVRALVAESLND